MMDGKNLPLNVQRLAKEKSMLLGTIEDEVGVSRGYFSRLIKNTKKSASVQIVIATAEVLDVKIEELLNEPPEFTNGKKFKEVFGFDPNGSGITSRGFENESGNGVFIRWDDKYVEPKSEVKL